MNKGLRYFSYFLVALVLLLGCIVVFVKPQRALSAAIMRDCVDLVRSKASGSPPLNVVSAAAIQSGQNRRKLEDFNRATQSVIERGDMIPSEPEVLVEFRNSLGNATALCSYDVSMYPKEGVYGSVRLKDLQIGVDGLSPVEKAMVRTFSVGYIDRLLSVIPIFGTEQKFMLD